MYYSQTGIIRQQAPGHAVFVLRRPAGHAEQKRRLVHHQDMAVPIKFGDRLPTFGNDIARGLFGPGRAAFTDAGPGTAQSRPIAFVIPRQCRAHPGSVGRSAPSCLSSGSPAAHRSHAGRRLAESIRECPPGERQSLFRGYRPRPALAR